jgi:hypothetical protein
LGLGYAMGIKIWSGKLLSAPAAWIPLWWLIDD